MEPLVGTRRTEWEIFNVLIIIPISSLKMLLRHSSLLSFIAPKE